MAPTTEFTDLKPELQSIERLINELIQRQSMLCSQLAMLESPDTQRSPAREAIAAAAPDNVPSSTSTPSWACVVKGRKKQSLPFYDPFSPGVNDVTLANFFSPLAKFHSEPVSPVPACSAARTQKRSVPSSASSLSGSASPLLASLGCKRPRLSSLQGVPFSTAGRG